MDPIEFPEPQVLARRTDRPLRPSPLAFGLGLVAGALAPALDRLRPLEIEPLPVHSEPVEGLSDLELKRGESLDRLGMDGEFRLGMDGEFKLGMDGEFKLGMNGGDTISST